MSRPLDSLRHIYLPLAQWIAAQKRRRGLDRLYVFGIQGTIGRGKTTLSKVLRQLVPLFVPRGSGQVVVLSLDDYYWPKAFRDRAAFRRHGYNPEGISNRGPAGTHEIALLRKHLRAFERSGPGSRFDLPVFDKQSDDRLDRPRRVIGRVGVVILEGWFLGCRTQVPIRDMKTPLRRAVARALPSYRPVFDRLDALWAFQPVPLPAIVANRWRQQRELNRRSGRVAMTRAQVQRFVRYFYRDAWQPGVSSPTPPDSAVTFWAGMDARYRFTRIRAGGRLLNGG